MRLLEFFCLIEADDEQREKHSPLCVCKGNGYIERVTHDQLPALPGQNMGMPVQGLKKVPCPYGDLKINRPPSHSTDIEDFDF